MPIPITHLLLLRRRRHCFLLVPKIDQRNSFRIYHNQNGKIKRWGFYHHFFFRAMNNQGYYQALEQIRNPHCNAECLTVGVRNGDSREQRASGPTKPMGDLIWSFPTSPFFLVAKLLRSKTHGWVCKQQLKITRDV